LEEPQQKCSGISLLLKITPHASSFGEAGACRSIAKQEYKTVRVPLPLCSTIMSRHRTCLTATGTGRRISPEGRRRASSRASEIAGSEKNKKPFEQRRRSTPVEKMIKKG
jgi:hypothetical protein